MIPYTRINIKNALQGEYEENNERKPFTITEVAAIYKAIEATRVHGRPKKITTTASKEENSEENKKHGKLPCFSEQGTTREITAKIVKNYGQKAVEKIVKIAEAVEGHPELKEIVDKADSGRKRLECAHSEIMRALDRDKPKLTPPTGKYEVLLVDPPWSYENSSVRGSPENHYAVLTNEELMQLALPAAENAVLFVWVPYPKTREAFDILDCWGFEYKSEIIWVKDKIGTGYYTRGKHEKLFICVKGDGLGVPAE